MCKCSAISNTERGAAAEGPRQRAQRSVPAVRASCHWHRPTCAMFSSSRRWYTSCTPSKTDRADEAREDVEREGREALRHRREAQTGDRKHERSATPARRDEPEATRRVHGAPSMAALAQREHADTARGHSSQASQVRWAPWLGLGGRFFFRKVGSSALGRARCAWVKAPLTMRRRH